MRPLSVIIMAAFADGTLPWRQRSILHNVYNAADNKIGAEHLAFGACQTKPHITLRQDDL